MPVTTVMLRGWPWFLLYAGRELSSWPLAGLGLPAWEGPVLLALEEPRSPVSGIGWVGASGSRRAGGSSSSSAQRTPMSSNSCWAHSAVVVLIEVSAHLLQFVQELVIPFLEGGLGLILLKLHCIFKGINVFSIPTETHQSSVS